MSKSFFAKIRKNQAITEAMDAQAMPKDTRQKPTAAKTEGEKGRVIDIPVTGNSQPSYTMDSVQKFRSAQRTKR